MKKRSLLSLLLFSCTLFTASAQTPLAKAFSSANDASGEFKNDFPTPKVNKKGTGYSVNPGLLAKPVKKVALVSFFYEDAGSSNESKLTNTANAWRVSDELGQVHVDGFYNSGAPALVQAFKEKNIELLLPKQFLDTEEKKAYYSSFEVEHHSIKNEKKEGASASVKKTGREFGETAVMYDSKYSKSASVDRLKITATDSQMKPMFLVNELFNGSNDNIHSNKMMAAGTLFLFDKQMCTSLGYDLAKKLDVDAVLVVWVLSFKTEKNKENYAVKSISGYMFGPNPVQREEEGGMSYARGIFYGGQRAYFHGMLPYQNEKKFKDPDFSGFANAMKGMANNMSKTLQED